MAILMIVEAPGMEPALYESINEAMGIRGDADAPEGLISHQACTTEDGMLVADVWESREAFDRFVAERLGPALGAASVPEIEPSIYEVHNHIPQGAGTAANVLLIADAPGFTTNVYDQLTSRMAAHGGDGSTHPAVFHVAARTADGMIFVDAWDSAESFGAFAEQQLAPAADQVEMPELTPRFLPIHNRTRGRIPAGV
jgi:heme-degrading monooxygenase HmoA